MARSALHLGMADLAKTGRDNARNDEERVLYDRAWAAHTTAANHVILADRHRADAAKALRMANIAGARPDAARRLVQVRVGGKLVTMTEAAHHHLVAQRHSQWADNHIRRSQERADEGNGHMAAVAKSQAPAPAPPAEQEGSA